MAIDFKIKKLLIFCDQKNKNHKTKDFHNLSIRNIFMGITYCISKEELILLFELVSNNPTHNIRF